MAQQIVIEVPGTKISELEKTSSVSRGDVVPVVQGETTKQADIGQIADFVKSELGSAALKNEEDFATPQAVSAVAQASQLRDDAQNERIDEVEFKTTLAQSGYEASFDSYAAMLAYTPSKPNVSVRVNNDTDSTKVGTYTWTGTQYKKGVDLLELSNKFTLDEILKSLDWIDQNKQTEVLNSSSLFKTCSKAILSVSMKGFDPALDYRIGTVIKNHPSQGSRVLLVNPSNGVVASYIAASTVVKSGIETVILTGAFGVSAEITIDWSVLSDGFSASVVSESKLYVAKSARNIYAESSKLSTDLSNLSGQVSQLGAPAPEWILESYKSTYSTNATAPEKSVAEAIKGIEFYGVHAYEYFKIIVFAKSHETYGNRIFIANPAGATVIQLDEKGVTRSGTETINLVPAGSSGLSATLTIDWDLLASGLIINSANSNLRMNPKAKNFPNSYFMSQKNAIDIASLQSSIGAASGSSKVATKPYHVSIAGSSIGWGAGYLGEQSYVGIVEQILRNQYAKTLHASTIAPNATTLTGNDFYQGSAKRIIGLNAEVSFNLDGDELSLSVARERENVGACLVELYIDNVLYDTFDTYTKLSVSRTENFTGNGSTIKFNLDGCFTYAHSVTVGGVAKVGKIATGNTIPSSDDYAVIRRYDSVNNRVVHALWFKEAPSGAIVVNYKQGENIRHLRGTIDRIGAGYDTALEYAYADGSTAYDPANPTAISSGFGFRESDKRSVKTWKFSESKSRSFKLKVKALHQNATGSTPYLDLNFVTNRMHHIQNAGIGGWSAFEFLNTTTKLNNVSEIINFNPDIVLIESCTNDDWSTGLFKAHVVKTGVTNAEILNAATANYFTAISGVSDNKTVNDVRIQMTAITSNTITLSPSVVDANIAVGDAVVIGDYGSNHKRVAVRIIKAYNSATKTITLNRSITVDDFYQANNLDDLLSEFVMIYNAPTWIEQVQQLADVISSALPDCKLNIATAGVPNYYLRRLFGYRELAQKVAKDKSLGFVDYYNSSFDFQYSQLVSTHQTITSSGASEYALTGTALTFPNPKVFVNGIEHKKFRVVGGLSKHWDIAVTDPTLANTSNTTKPFKLIFDADVPASGATIVIQKSAIAWSADYCHPTGPQGFFVLGQAATSILNLN